MEYYKVKNKLCVIVTLWTVAMSCNGDNNESNGFYDASKTYDLYRIPLIDPYQLVSADNGLTWMFNRNNKQNVVNRVGLLNSIIVLYSKRTALPGKMAEAWFVVNAENNEEIVFTSEEQCYEFLTSVGVNRLKLYDISAIFSEFDKYKILPPGWRKKT